MPDGLPDTRLTCRERSPYIRSWGTFLTGSHISDLPGVDTRMGRVTTPAFSVVGCHGCDGNPEWVFDISKQRCQSYDIHPVRIGQPLLEPVKNGIT